MNRFLLTFYKFFYYLLLVEKNSISLAEEYLVDKKLVIHIGFGKTGTTFLQERFFLKQKEICYIGVPIKHPVYEIVDLYVRKLDRIKLSLASNEIFKFLESQKNTALLLSPLKIYWTTLGLSVQRAKKS